MSLNNYQRSLLDLMKRLDVFFRENGLDYYLLGGSLIGALRHEGFIPWDDDMDIMVTRDVYEQLVEMEDRLPYDIEFVCFENTPEFCKPYGMFSLKTDTCTSYNRFFWGGRCMGTAIDVFVMDDMNSEDFDEFFKTLVIHQDVIYKIKLSSEKIIDYKDEYFSYKDREKTEGRSVVIKELRDKLKSFADRDDCDKRVVTTWSRSNLRQYSIDWVQKPKYAKFEDTEFAVPTKPEACLRLQYGYDWYMIPASTEQLTHDFCINPDISYNNYYSDMDRFIDWESAYEAIDISKRTKIENLETILKVRRFWQETAVNRVLMQYESETDDGRMQIVADGDYYGFLEMMQPFMSYRAAFSAAGKTGAVSDIILAEWLMQLMKSGRYYHAMKVSKAFCKGRDDGNVKSVMELLDKVSELAACWQDRDTAGMKNMLAKIPSDIQDAVPDCILAKGRLYFDGLSDYKNRDELIGKCRHYLESYPRNYDIMKLLGDLLWDSGYEEEAMELYHKVNDNSRNGLDLLDLKNRFGFEHGYLMKFTDAGEDDEDEE